MLGQFFDFGGDDVLVNPPCDRRQVREKSQPSGQSFSETQAHTGATSSPSWYHGQRSNSHRVPDQARSRSNPKSSDARMLA